MSNTSLPISSIAALAPQQSMATSAATSAATSGATGTTSATQSANIASESTFLQLLVAQLKNQDPEQPTDGTQFVTELAQFTTLSQDTESASDLDTIVAALPSLEAGAASGATATGTGTTTTNTTNAVTQ